MKIKICKTCKGLGKTTVYYFGGSYYGTCPKCFGKGKK